MPRRHHPSRPVGALLLTALAMVATAAVVAADRLGPGDEPPQPGLSQAQVVPPTTPPLTPEEARGHLQSRREARRTNGQTSVAEQLRAHPSPDLGNMYVVASLDTPMPWSIYSEQRQSQGSYYLGDEVVSITTYVELPGGYPITSTGAPDDDFAGSISAFLDEPTTKERLQEAASPRYAIEDRLVLLGFAMRYQDFERLEPDISSRLDLAAAEVVDSPDAPPIGPSDPLTAKAVAAYELAYLAREGYRAMTRAIRPFHQKFSRMIRFGVAGLVASLMLLVGAPPKADAVPNSWRYRPSLWTPTDFVSLLDRDAAWGDVAYWWKWLSPNNTSSSLYDPGGRGTLELGWKNTGTMAVTVAMVRSTAEDFRLA